MMSGLSDREPVCEVPSSARLWRIYRPGSGSGKGLSSGRKTGVPGGKCRASSAGKSLNAFCSPRVAAVWPSVGAPAATMSGQAKFSWYAR